LAIGCTVGELRRRMGSREFTNWLEFMHEEGLGPAAQLQQWAESMAALFNGPMTRKSGKPWTAADFMPRPWKQPEAPKPASGKDARAFVRQQRALRDAAKP
jgi:hypothetical protein